MRTEGLPSCVMELLRGANEIIYAEVLYVLRSSRGSAHARIYEPVLVKLSETGPPFLSRVKLLLLLPEIRRTSESLHHPASHHHDSSFLRSVGALLGCTRCPCPSPKSRQALCPVQLSLSLHVPLHTCACNSQAYKAQGLDGVSRLSPPGQWRSDTLLLCDRISDAVVSTLYSSSGCRGRQ